MLKRMSRMKGLIGLVVVLIACSASLFTDGKPRQAQRAGLRRGKSRRLLSPHLVAWSRSAKT